MDNPAFITRGKYKGDAPLHQCIGHGKDRFFMQLNVQHRAIDVSGSRKKMQCVAHRTGRANDMCTSFFELPSQIRGDGVFIFHNEQVAPVQGCRTVTKADMRLNDYTPRMQIDAQTYQVRADGQLLGCEHAQGQKWEQARGEGHSQLHVQTMGC